MTEKVANTYEDVVIQALKLSPLDKANLMKLLAASLEHDLEDLTKTPRRSLFGILAPYGPAPSAEDIDEARREMWGNFPREDIP